MPAVSRRGAAQPEGALQGPGTGTRPMKRGPSFPMPRGDAVAGSRRTWVGKQLAGQDEGRERSGRTR